MQNAGVRPSKFDLTQQGLRALQTVYWNLGTAQLIEQAIQRHEGMLASGGAFSVRTGMFTTRSPLDRYIVRDTGTENTVEWGEINQPLTPEQFEELFQRMVLHLRGEDVFVQDCFVGADPAESMPIRVVTRRAWHNLFARQLFVRPDPDTTEDHVPEFTVFCTPMCFANPKKNGTHSQTSVAIDFTRKMVLIMGTEYAGEIKKSIFSVLNYLLPFKDVMPMHCSANMDVNGRTALFFGLSGTGKATLSSDTDRRLIGDDEHGWGDNGIFNFEGGCYARCLHLTEAAKPQLWNAIRFGTVLENVMMDPDLRLLDFNSDELTDNTRAAYRMNFIDNAVIPGIGGHPSHILFLAADAFGVLPPVARLTPAQAMYHFMSGYTAKPVNADRELEAEPEATFSACFGAPFLPRHPKVYAKMLGEKLKKHNVQCYLVNTGWSGGPYGVGSRIKLEHTRAIVNAIVAGKLDGAETVPHPVFQILVPKAVPGVPDKILDARGLWSDPTAYDSAVADLSARFKKNFERFGHVAGDIKAAGPA